MMYMDFFGFMADPFGVTPDPAFLYLSEQHREALSLLDYGIKSRVGFVEITGEVGCGKTTISRALLGRLPDTVSAALIPSPSLAKRDLLEAVISDLGIPIDVGSKKDLIEPFHLFLLQGYMQGRNVVIIIDEAHSLRPAQLEELRLLSNLETEKAKLLQIVLVGQPELHDVLKQPSLRQLNQRITVRYCLHPLGASETEDYIYHRIRIAGGASEVEFSQEALEEIYAQSGGVPRLVNAICARCLVGAGREETNLISGKLARMAAIEVMGKGLTSQVKTSSLLPSEWWKYALAGALIPVAGLAIWMAAERPLQGIGSLIRPNGRPGPEMPLPVAASPTASEARDLAPAEASPTASSTSPPSSPVYRLPTPALLSSPSPSRVEQPVCHFEGLDGARLLVAEMARFWLKDESPGISFWKGLGGKTYKELSAGAGLTCSSFDFSPAQVKRLQVPGVVRQVGSGDPGVLVMRVDGEEAWILTPAGQVSRSPLSSLESQEGVFYVVIWKDSLSLKPPIQKGAIGAHVVKIQGELKKMGFDVGEADGVYDSRTEQAIRSLQEKTGISTDGSFGPETAIVFYRQMLSGEVPALKDR